jgi:tetraacyldisaccharide 4'-kinase
MPGSKNNIKLRFIFYPISILYGIVIWVRHKLFDWKLISSTAFKIPVICVGNLTVGGTGKTPHIEYLVNLLKNNFKIAVLSRGYKRKTKGFVLADKNATPKTIGDEPYQIFRKYKNISVAVSEKRVKGISNLLNNNSKLQAVLLDDAFQHRYVNPGVNIVLIDFNRPIFNDRLLPVGKLRDTISQMKRADIVVITKTPSKLSPIDKRIFIRNLNLYPYQKLFFTAINYGEPIPIFSIKQGVLTLSRMKNENTRVLLVTGIANPKPLSDYIRSMKVETTSLPFPDHHNFTEYDIQYIEEDFNALPGTKNIILTTEKDAVRFKYLEYFPESLKDKIYYVPIKVEFLYNGDADFDKTILTYVSKNKKIGQLYS